MAKKLLFATHCTVARAARTCNISVIKTDVFKLLCLLASKILMAWLFLWFLLLGRQILLNYYRY